MSRPWLLWLNLDTLLPPWKVPTDYCDTYFQDEEAEDEEELLTTLGLLLRDQGYNVIAVKMAEDALMIVQKSAPDLILAAACVFSFTNKCIGELTWLSANPITWRRT